MVLGAASGQERFEAATALLDYGFAYFENVQAPLPQDAPRQIAVTHGMETAIDLEYTTPGQYLMYRGQNASLRTEIELPQNLAAPVKAGTAGWNRESFVRGGRGGLLPDSGIG